MVSCVILISISGSLSLALGMLVGRYGPIIIGSDLSASMAGDRDCLRSGLLERAAILHDPKKLLDDPKKLLAAMCDGLGLLQSWGGSSWAVLVVLAVRC